MTVSKRGAFFGAVALIGVLGGGVATADPGNGNGPKDKEPPGQVCKEFPPGERGDCARVVAKGGTYEPPSDGE